MAEHHNVRTAAGLFDVGHMVQSTLVSILRHSQSRFSTSSNYSYTGPGALGFLHKVLPATLNSLALQKSPSDQEKYSSSLGVLLNENGGIIDDCMITRWAPEKSVAYLQLARRTTIAHVWISIDSISLRTLVEL